MKTVLITGASSGFGKRSAELLSEKGYKLILVARRFNLLEEIKSKLSTPTHIAKLDITKKLDVESFFDNLPKEFKDIDVLINNAGLARGLESAFDSSIEEWDEMIDVNIKGLLYMTKYTLKTFQKRNSGLVINIGSVASSVPYKGGNVYGATKAFVKQFSRNLRTDLHGTNIRVTNIEPGMSNETEFSEVRFRGDKTRASDVYKGTRPLNSTDIAKTICWVVEQPEHVNLDNIEITPLDQTFGGMSIRRD